MNASRKRLPQAGTIGSTTGTICSTNRRRTSWAVTVVAVAAEPSALHRCSGEPGADSPNAHFVAHSGADAARCARDLRPWSRRFTQAGAVGRDQARAGLRPSRRMTRTITYTKIRSPFSRLACPNGSGASPLLSRHAAKPRWRPPI